MKYPPFFQEEKKNTLFPLSYQEIANYAHAQRKVLSPSSTKRLLCIIDPQIGFCMPGRDLFVQGNTGKGALDDMTRLTRFLYANIEQCTDIMVSLDSHSLYSIFHTDFWINADGAHPAPMTAIDISDIEKKNWLPSPHMTTQCGFNTYNELLAYVKNYIQSLHSTERFQLILWPYHCITGSIDHAILPMLDEAITYHSFLHQKNPNIYIKGTSLLTENYSVIGPEYNYAREQKIEFTKNILAYDEIYIAGEAKSHCVAWTIQDIITSCKNTEDLKKIYLIEDAMSPVVVPGIIDYTEQTNTLFHSFQKQGMHRMRCEENGDPTILNPR